MSIYRTAYLIIYMPDYIYLIIDISSFCKLIYKVHVLVKSTKYNLKRKVMNGSEIKIVFEKDFHATT